MTKEVQAGIMRAALNGVKHLRRYPGRACTAPLIETLCRDYVPAQWFSEFNPWIMPAPACLECLALHGVIKRQDPVGE
jgi:hypothetical protein